VKWGSQRGDQIVELGLSPRAHERIPNVACTIAGLAAAVRFDAQVNISDANQRLSAYCQPLTVRIGRSKAGGGGMLPL
jgi:hypothetical protein